MVKLPGCRQHYTHLHVVGEEAGALQQRDRLLAREVVQGAVQAVVRQQVVKGRLALRARRPVPVRRPAQDALDCTNARRAPSASLLLYAGQDKHQKVQTPAEVQAPHVLIAVHVQQASRTAVGVATAGADAGNLLQLRVLQADAAGHLVR